ncbi:MAG: hypothetical protein IJZ04_03010 [Clostridia bacterium]|nr:hypothetical protein [Clostridia bacterium]
MSGKIVRNSCKEVLSVVELSYNMRSGASQMRSSEWCYRKCGVRNAEFGMEKTAS